MSSLLTRTISRKKHILVFSNFKRFFFNRNDQFSLGFHGTSIINITTTKKLLNPIGQFLSNKDAGGFALRVEIVECDTCPHGVKPYSITSSRNVSILYLTSYIYQNHPPPIIMIRLSDLALFECCLGEGG